MAHLTLVLRHYRCSPSRRALDMALRACSMNLRRVRWTARCGLVLAPPYWQQKRRKGCSAATAHVSPSFLFRGAHVERGPASGVAPSRSPVATLHCAFCACSVVDLCMAVQHVVYLSKQPGATSFTREVQVPPKREPTALLVQILVQELVLFLNHEPWFFLWSQHGCSIQIW